MRFIMANGQIKGRRLLLRSMRISKYLSVLNSLICLNQVYSLFGVVMPHLACYPYAKEYQAKFNLYSGLMGSLAQNI